MFYTNIPATPAVGVFMIVMAIGLMMLLFVPMNLRFYGRGNQSNKRTILIERVVGAVLVLTFCPYLYPHHFICTHIHVAEQTTQIESLTNELGSFATNSCLSPQKPLLAQKLRAILNLPKADRIAQIDSTDVIIRVANSFVQYAKNAKL